MTIEYLAGFFDGEGSVGAYLKGKNDRRYTVSVTIGGLDSRPIKMFQERYGGNVRVAIRRVYPVYTWQVSGNKAEKVLLEMLPYLTVKKRQAVLALKFIQMLHKTNTKSLWAGRGKALPVEEVAKRKAIALRIKELKREYDSEDSASDMISEGGPVG